jgi:azurin
MPRHSVVTTSLNRTPTELRRRRSLNPTSVNLSTAAMKRAPWSIAAPPPRREHPSLPPLEFTMKRLTPLFALSLFAAAGFAQAAPNCTLKLKGNDQMQYDLKTATVSASCPTISIELTHTGKLPAQVMGHNVVISASKDLPGITADGMKAGAAAGYVAKGDVRVLAATPVAGGGATVRAKLAGKRLKAGGDYSFYCSFPGHAAIMKGKLVVTK